MQLLSVGMGRTASASTGGEPVHIMVVWRNGFECVPGAPPTRSQENVDTGMALQKECQAAVSYKNDPSPLTMQYGAHCFGYVGGLTNMLRLWEATNKANNVSLDGVPACLPEDGSTGQYVRVVLHYLDQHPERLRMAYALLIVTALRDAFPCPATPAK